MSFTSSLHHGVHRVNRTSQINSIHIVLQQKGGARGSTQLEGTTFVIIYQKFPYTLRVQKMHDDTLKYLYELVYRQLNETRFYCQAARENYPKYTVLRLFQSTTHSIFNNIWLLESNMLIRVKSNMNDFFLLKIVPHLHKTKWLPASA